MKTTFDSFTSSQVHLRVIHSRLESTFDIFTSKLKIWSILSLRHYFPFLKFHLDSFTSTWSFRSTLSHRPKLLLRSFHFDQKISLRPIHFVIFLIFLDVSLRCCTSTFFSLRYMHFDSSCTSILSHRFEPIVMYRSAILVEVNGTKCENAYMYRSACQPYN